MRIADHLLRPDFIYRNVSAIDFTMHAKDGFRYLALDVDGTITHPGSWIVEGCIPQILQTNMENGNLLGVCLLSNVGIKSSRREERIEILAECLRVKYVCAYYRPRFMPTNPDRPRLKPDSEAFLAAMSKLGSDPTNTMMAGDQLFTDIFGGNLLNMRTIWISNHLGYDNPITLPKRIKERFVVNRLGLTCPSS